MKRQVAQALADFCPVLGLLHWRIIWNVVSAEELTKQAFKWGLEQEQDVADKELGLWAIIRPTPGMARALMWIAYDKAYGTPGDVTVAEVVLHELGHIVATEFEFLDEHNGDSEKFFDWLAGVLSRAKEQFGRRRRT